MNEKPVYLTFKTDKKTSEMLKIIAQGFNMTQPDYIDYICKENIRKLNELAELHLKELGIEY